MDQIFSDREIAVSIWVGFFLIWVLTKKEVRESSKKLILTFCHSKILISYGLMGLYVFCLVSVLSDVGVWGLSQLKNTLMWFLFVASIEIFKATSIVEDNSGYF